MWYNLYNQTDIQTYTQTDIQTHTQTDTQTDIQTDTQTDIWTDGRFNAYMHNIPTILLVDLTTHSRK